MKAYLSIYKGKPVASLTEEPVISTHNAHHWQRTMFDWESDLMDIENVEKYDAGSEGIVYFIKIGKRCVQFTPQQAEIEITENGCIITKII